MINLSGLVGEAGRLTGDVDVFVEGEVSEERVRHGQPVSGEEGVSMLAVEKGMFSPHPPGTGTIALQNVGIPAENKLIFATDKIQVKDNFLQKTLKNFHKNL